MSSTATKGRSAIFWILVVLGVSCAGCSALTVGLMGLGLLAADDASPTPGGSASPQRSQSALPTGNTPDLFPGMPGWLPSGRGVTIPAAEVSDDGPVGLWWYWQTLGDSTTARRLLFLSDGTRASNPRPGGGNLFDLEGQRAQRGSTGLGTFEIEGDVIKEHVEGVNTRNHFRFGSDGEGPWLEISSMRLWPLAPPTDADLIGTWKGPGVKYVFRADGTFESGAVTQTGGFVAAGGGAGTWRLDGYLLQLSPSGAPGWITTVGLTGNETLVVGPSVCKRE